MVESCVFKDNAYGIYMGLTDESNALRISNCLISTSSLGGITMYDCKNAQILNAEITRYIDSNFGGAGIDIQGGSNVSVNDCFIAGFFRGLYLRTLITGFTIQSCMIESNIRGISAASNIKGCVRQCTVQNNGSGNARGCGILDSTGAATKVWYVANMAMSNGDRPAATSSRYDTNYCTGVDTPAATMSGIEPEDGSSTGGNTRGPFFQLIRDQGGGGGGAGGVLSTTVIGCIGYWDNITAALM
jgi:hypothetical protein